MIRNSLGLITVRVARNPTVSVLVSGLSLCQLSYAPFDVLARAFDKYGLYISGLGRRHHSSDLITGKLGLSAGPRPGEACQCRPSSVSDGALLCLLCFVKFTLF